MNKQQPHEHQSCCPVQKQRNIIIVNEFCIEIIMPKNKISKKSNKAAVGGSVVVLRNNDDTAFFFPYNTFKAALQMYAHPAAVADLERLPHGGPSWKRYLEAFGNSVKDLSIMHLQQDFGITERFMGMFDMVEMVNRGCPLLVAFSAWKGQQFLKVLNPLVHYKLIYLILPDWGRPLLPKSNSFART